MASCEIGSLNALFPDSFITIATDTDTDADTETKTHTKEPPNKKEKQSKDKRNKKQNIYIYIHMSYICVIHALHIFCKCSVHDLCMLHVF